MEVYVISLIWHLKFPEGIGEKRDKAKKDNILMKYK